MNVLEDKELIGKNHLSSPVIMENRKTKRKKKFNGKLSHATNVSPIKITKFFNIQERIIYNEESRDVVSDVHVTNDFNDKSSVHTVKRNALRESNSEVLKNSTGEDEYVSEATTREKFSFSVKHQEASLNSLSPSSAFSRLNIQNKKSKVRRRLSPIYKNNERCSKEITCDLIKLDSFNNNQQSKLTEFFPIRKSVRKTQNAILAEKQKQIEEAIISQKEPDLEVRAFLGKGRGVIATRKFEKGDFVVEYAGELISFELAQKREAVYGQDENTGCYMYYFTHKSNKYCIDATAESNRLGRLLNHSRNGNLCPKTIEVNGKPHIVMVAKVDIQPGTELTYDYGDRSKKSIQYHPWLAF